MARIDRTSVGRTRPATRSHTMNDRNEVVHAVQSNIDTIFTWDYSRSREPLVKLYEKAKSSQWNASTDLDWTIDVDPERIATELGGGTTSRFAALRDADDSPVRNFDEKQWL